MLAHGFEILNYGEVALLQQWLFLSPCMNPSYFTLQASSVNKMKNLVLCLLVLYVLHWGGWKEKPC